MKDADVGGEHSRVHAIHRSQGREPIDHVRVLAPCSIAFGFVPLAKVASVIYERVGGGGDLAKLFFIHDKWKQAGSPRLVGAFASGPCLPAP